MQESIPTQRAPIFNLAASPTSLPPTRNEDGLSDTHSSSPLLSTKTSTESNGVLRFNFQPDIPIASIEQGSYSHNPDFLDRSQYFRPRTPSFNVTPSVSDFGSFSERRILTPKSRTRSPTPVGNRIDDRLANLSLDQLSVPYRDSPTPSLTREASCEPKNELKILNSSTRPSHPGAALSNVCNYDGFTFKPNRDLLSPEPEPIPHASSRRRSSSFNPRASSTGNSPAYDIADEKRPEARFHEPEFQAAISGVENTVQRLVSVLESSPLHGDPQSSLASLYAQARALRRFQHSSTRVVGLVGDSGVGKSSLINSLLHVGELAQTGGSGAACTCVVTEYCYTGENTFVLEPEYFSSSELRSQLTQLLSSYRKCHLVSSGDGGDAQASEIVKEEAKLAEDMFRSAFKTFIGRDLQVLLKDTESVARSKLFSWAAQSGFDISEDRHRLMKKQEFDNVNDCSAALRTLTSNSIAEHSNSVWPFIRKIKVHLRSEILRNGLILADLPGLRDLNSARVHITEIYLLQCDEILAVCSINRAQSDAGLSEIFQLAEKASLPKIGIVCTRSDDIQPDEARNNFPMPARETVGQVTDRINELQDHVKRLEAERNDVQDFMSSPYNVDEACQLDFLNLTMDITEKEQSIKQQKFELKRHLMSTRNDLVSAGLKELYRCDAIFCVSNTDYRDHQQKPKNDALPYLELSQIPDLRNHCLSLVAESQLQCATKYIKDAVPSLLHSLEIWIQASSPGAAAESKKLIHDTLDRITRELNSLRGSGNIFRLSQSLQSQFFEQVLLFMMTSTTQWQAAALKASRDWSGWTPGTYTVFCQHFGDHSTATVGRHFWNAEAMEVMVKEMSPLLDHAYNCINQTSRDRVLKKAENVFDHAIRLGASHTQLSTLQANLDHRQRLLQYELCGELKSFSAKLEALRTQAFSGIRSSFMAQALEPAYRAARGQHSTGSDRRRKDIIERAFGAAEIWDHLREQLREHIVALTTALEEDLLTIVERHLAVIEGDIKNSRDENAVAESECDPRLLTMLQREVAEAERELEKCIRGAFPQPQGLLEV